MKDQIKCDNCHNSFDFFWCAGHTIMENNAKSLVMLMALFSFLYSLWRKVYKKYVPCTVLEPRSVK